MSRVLKSKLHADAEVDAVFLRVDRLRAAAGVEVAGAEIGVAVLDATEHVFRELHVDAGAGRPAEQGVAVVTARVTDLKTLGSAAGSAVEQDVVGNGDAHAAAQ